MYPDGAGNLVALEESLLHFPRLRPNANCGANAYERDMADVPALENDVARAVAGEIQIMLTPQERARLGRSVPTRAFRPCCVD